MRLRILSAAEVRQALPMNDAIDAMRRAFGQFSADEVEQPWRSRLETDRGTVLLMPAFLKQSRELALKFVSEWGNNSTGGLPATVSMAVVLDPDTGQPVALINGQMLTRLRTGAGGGLAADLLARPDAAVVTVFGAGVQARSQLEAVCSVRRIKEVRIFGMTPSSVEAFVKEIRAWPNAPHTVLIAGSRNEAVQGADIVITATTAATPVFDGRYLSPGTHVNAIGSGRPDRQEVDGETVRRARIVVDSLSICLVDSGDLLVPLSKNIISKADIYGEIGQIVNGEKLGRQSPDEITMFESVGLAVQDAAAAAQILRAAAAQGLGTMVEW